MARRVRHAFTLVELLAVIAVIGILLVLILVAAGAAAKEAQVEATRQTIAKLDTAMGDMLEMLLTSRNDPTVVHGAWAQIYFTTAPFGPISATDRSWRQRAEVLANYDKIRAELPDVFFIQNTTLGTTTYPLNFAQQPFKVWGNQYDYVLPIGTGNPVNQPFPGNPANPGTGIFGASYTAAAGLYKNLGNVPQSVLAGATPLANQGYNGVDDDADGLIDNIGEGLQGNVAITTSVTASLANHQHKTSRSEMLYALLVEGRGPFGQVLSPDNFTSKEIADTDNDGLPEFVDAWGEPIYFYRWPIFYPSDVQKGAVSPPTGPYANVFQPREVDPLDQNQQLISVPWWSSVNNAGPGPSGAFGAVANFSSVPPLSGGALAFQNYFHQLVEPFSKGGASPLYFWDRSALFSQRRAFYTRFLIISSGPDKTLGLPVASDAAIQGFVNAANPDGASALLRFESHAAPYDLTTWTSPSVDPIYGFAQAPVLADSANSTAFGNAAFGAPTYVEEALDDISNHNLQSSGSQQ